MGAYRYYLNWVAAAAEAAKQGRAVYGLKSREQEQWAFA